MSTRESVVEQIEMRRFRSFKRTSRISEARWAKHYQSGNIQDDEKEDDCGLGTKDSEIFQGSGQLT